MPARKKKSRPNTRSSREPFNNPFADDLRKLGRKLRASRGATPSAEAPPPKVKPAEVRQPAMSDSESFLEATRGAAPIAKGGRRVPRRTSADAIDSRPRPSDCDVDPTADEHFDIRFSDQFIRGRASGVSRETVSKLERGEFAVRSHVDLHGMALDDAMRTVDEFLASSQRRGERCVLVVTGKGRNSPGQVGVLRENIPGWLARGPSARRLLAFVTARPCDGGEGALYVLLRRSAGAKQRIDVEAGSGA